MLILNSSMDGYMSRLSCLIVRLALICINDPQGCTSSLSDPFSNDFFQVSSEVTGLYEDYLLSMKFVTYSYQTVTSQSTSSESSIFIALLLPFHCTSTSLSITYLLKTCPGAFISRENLRAQLFQFFSPHFKENLTLK